MDEQIKHKRRRRWVRILKVSVLIYALLGIGLYYSQELFLFHPKPLPQDHQFRFASAFQEHRIPVNREDTVSVIRFLPAGTARRGVVLYFHGNKGNVNRYAKFTEVFLRNGYEVLMADYPGYGKTTGERTEKKLYQQALQVYALALSYYPADSIIVYGKSLGTGIAGYVASMRTCRQLILETPYYDIPFVFGCYAPIYPVNRMITYKLPLYQYLQDVRVPVTVFHGTDDWIIPLRCSRRLKPFLKPTDAYVVLENGTHHDLYGFPEYQQKMNELLVK